MPHHRFEQHLHPVDIVVEIEERLLHALPHQRICREMKYRLDAALRKDTVKCRRIANIPLAERRLRMQRASMSRLQIIDNDDLFAPRNQLMHRMRADVARTAANQYSHEHAPFRSILQSRSEVGKAARGNTAIKKMPYGHSI